MVKDICENKISGEFWFNPDNFPTFKSRLEILKLKLDHDPTLLDNICKTLNDYESESIIESDACPRTRYPALPHHPANKNEKGITKFKLIIDGSSHFKNELSLDHFSNPYFMFMKHFTPRLALLAGQVVTNDIKQAYLQTEVKEKHRNFLPFNAWKLQVCLSMRDLFVITRH